MKDELLEKKIELLERNLSYKKDPFVLLELALVYDRTDRFIDAHKKFDELISSYPRFLKGFFFRIFFLIKWGRKENFFDAVEKYFFTKFFEDLPLSFLPSKEDVKKNLVFFKSVLDLLGQSLSLNPNSLNDLIIKAFCLFVLDNNEYEELYNYIIENFKDNFRAYYLYSLMCIDKQDYSKAIMYLKKMIDYNPVFDNSYLLLGYVYLKQGIFNQALLNLKKATELNSKSAIASILLAKYLIILEKYDDAIEVLYNKAKMIEPNNPQIYHYLAQAYKGKNEYEKALKIYESLEIFNYQNPQVKKEIADIYLILGDYNKAKKILTELKDEILFFDEEIYEKLIIVDDRLGNLDSALILVNQALSFEERIDFLRLGAKIAFRKGDLELAYKWYKKLQDKGYKDFEVFYNLGIIELTKMRFALAQSYFEESINIDPTKNESKYFLALTYAFQDKIEQSINTLINLRDNIKDTLKSKIVAFNIASAYSILGDVDKTEKFLYDAIVDFIRYFKNVNEMDILIYTTLLFQTRVIYEASKSNRELEESQSQTIRAMLDAIQAKDNYTKDHTQRVTIVSAEIAKAMGLPQEVIQVLLVGTLVHDLGKIGIPDSILNKPGKLTDEEFQIMKQHTIIGYEIVKKMKFPKLKIIQSTERFDNIGDVAACVRYHHEKWDGTGYPDGLKEHQIPLLARIIAVADVFDALMSERQYKKGLPAFKTIEIIEQSKGTHFDPMVVDYFLKIVDDLVLILYAGGNVTRAYFDRDVEELLRMSKEDILRDIGRF